MTMSSEQKPQQRAEAPLEDPLTKGGPEIPHRIHTRGGQLGDAPIKDPLRRMQPRTRSRAKQNLRKALPPARPPWGVLEIL